MSQLLNKLTNLVVSKITDENLIQSDNRNYMEIEENTFYKDIDYNFKLCLHFHNAAGSFEDFENPLILIDGEHGAYIRKLNDNFNICIYYIQQNLRSDAGTDIGIYANTDVKLFNFYWFLNYNNNKMVFDLGDAEEYCTSISNNLDLPWIDDYSGYALNEDVDEFHIHFYFNTDAS